MANGNIMETKKEDISAKKAKQAIAGLVLSIIFLVLTLINSAIGVYINYQGI
ncbi:MAG TPA: hypothetical protein VMX18_02380 [Candidatus Bipolaricaulota bacterium]|nr:hypothetical protein [Candidatus Bipolaricaulota bacterium]